MLQISESWDKKLRLCIQEQNRTTNTSQDPTIKIAEVLRRHVDKANTPKISQITTSANVNFKYSSKRSVH